MPVDHIVKQGECLAQIAQQYRFCDYRTVYDHQVNSDLRQKRPNPFMIHPGDVVVIPDKDEGAENCATGKRHKFVLKRHTRVVRLRVHYDDGDPIADTPYVLTCGDNEATGFTDSDGGLEEHVPVEAEEAILDVGGRVWTLKIGHLNPAEDTDDEGVTGYQARLRNLGYDPGPVDGVAGPLTKRAVRAFQADHPPLEVDGVCGPEALAKLKEVHGS